jgi:protein-disulfide isomerase
MARGNLERKMLTLPVSERDHSQGMDNASITLVEYGDYECPYCGQAYPIIKNIQKILGSQLRFVFRNFPISQIHPHALSAAEAAEAADSQHKFWIMHDYLYEHQDRLDDDDLVQYASTLGLDLDRFSKEVAEHTHAARVREDFMSGIRSGVNGTPTFYINDIRYDDSWDEDTLLASLKQAIVDEQQHLRSKESRKTAATTATKGTKQKTSRKTHYRK